MKEFDAHAALEAAHAKREKEAAALAAFAKPSRPRGRPALPVEQRTVTRSHRLPPDAWAVFDRQGGLAWLRKILKIVG